MVNPITKTVALSELDNILNPHLCLRNPFGSFVKGELIEMKRPKFVSQRGIIGIVGKEKIKCFAPVSKKLTKNFKLINFNFRKVNWNKV